MLREMAAAAMIVPTKVLSVPRVAELATCQWTEQLRAAPRKTTSLPAPVMSVSSTWKMKTAAGSPRVSSVRVPVIWALGSR